jgi:hypothetical protein
MGEWEMKARTWKEQVKMIKKGRSGKNKRGRFWINIGTL